MSDRFDESLREALHRAELPAAPEGLRKALEELPMDTQYDRRLALRSRTPRIAAGMIALAAALAIAFFGIYLPLSRPAAVPAASATASTTPVPTPTATETPAPTPTPTATAAATTSAPPATPVPTMPAPTATPIATGIPGAVSAMKAYEDALVAGDYQAAWNMLPSDAPVKQQGFGAYKTERAAFMASAGRAYTVTPNPSGTQSIASWLQGQPFASKVDQAHAVLIEVDWTALASNNAGMEMWVASPSNAGWQLYQVR